MRAILRNILKNILGYLSRRSVIKHNTEIIIITGWAGTRVVRELAYNLLSDEFNVRRNTTEVWWDLSVPLTILGYNDCQRSIFGWILLIIKALYSIIFNPTYPHKIIININTSVEDIAEFWSKYFDPHIVVILKEKPSSKVVEMICQSEGSEKVLFVYNPELFSGFKKKAIREFRYSSNEGELIYRKEGNSLNIRYKNEEAKVRIPKSYKFIWEFIPAAISIGILEGVRLKTLAKNVSYFSFHPQQLKQGISQLKEFIGLNEN